MRKSTTTTIVVYRNYSITYEENEDMWACVALDIKDPKLSKIKDAIDIHGRADRRINITALLVEQPYYGDPGKYTKVQVTMLCEKERYDTDHCWVKEGKHRAKVRVDEIVPKEHEGAVKNWMILRQAAVRADKAAEEAFEAIPKFDADSLLLAAKKARGEK